MNIKFNSTIWFLGSTRYFHMFRSKCKDESENDLNGNDAIRRIGINGVSPMVVRLEIRLLLWTSADNLHKVTRKDITELCWK